jgi:hypothetical protein
MTEYYRQFAFVTSVLGGFAFALFGTLLLATPSHRAASWAAILSVTASVAFLLDTLGMTFGGIYSASLPAGGTMPPRIASQLGLLSQLFCWAFYFCSRALRSAAGSGLDGLGLSPQS